jgi:ribosomal protein L31E
MRRCYWGLRWHKAETAVQWMGVYRPACYDHRVIVELAILDMRLLKRQWERSMEKVIEVINTPAEKVERWAKVAFGRRAP